MSTQHDILILQWKDYPRFSRQQEVDLARKSKEKDATGAATSAAIEARNQLVESVIPWACRIAMNFSTSCTCEATTLAVDDLIGEAMQILVAWVDHFNPKLGYRLTTYLWPVIWTRLTSYTRSLGHVIALPSSRAAGEGSQAAEKIVWGGISTLCENEIPDRSDPIEEYEDSEEHRVRMDGFREMLDQLSSREKAILLARYAGDTLEEIAAVHGISRQRVDQLEDRAIRSIRRIRKTRSQRKEAVA